MKIQQDHIDQVVANWKRERPDYDLAPVEIIGLLFSTLRWLSEVRSKGKFPFEGVNATGESLLDRCGFRRFSASEGLYTFGVSFQSTEYNGL